MIELPEDVVTKIAWVEGLVQRYDRDCAEWAASEPIRPVVIDPPFELMEMTSSDGSTLSFKMLSVEAAASTPSDLALLAGDIVTNLRSALDYLARALVLTHGAPPVVGPAGTRFPIATERRSNTIGIRGVHSVQLDDAVTALQPFNSQSPLQHPLHRLNQLANQNKHHSIPLLSGAGGVPAVFALVDRQESGAKIMVQPLLRWLRPGDYIDTLMFPEHPARPLDAAASFEPMLTFDLDGRQVVSSTEELDFLLRFVRDKVIPSFREFFSEPWPWAMFTASDVKDPHDKRVHVTVEQIQAGVEGLVGRYRVAGDPEPDFMVMSLIEGISFDVDRVG